MCYTILVFICLINSIKGQTNDLSQEQLILAVFNQTEGGFMPLPSEDNTSSMPKETSPAPIYVKINQVRNYIILIQNNI